MMREAADSVVSTKTWPLSLRCARTAVKRPEFLSALQSISRGGCVPMYSANNAVTPHGLGT